MQVRSVLTVTPASARFISRNGKRRFYTLRKSEEPGGC